MQVVLVMLRNDGQRRSFSVHKPQTVLGRREDCDVRIPLGEISRKHCRLIKDENELRIEDLGSSNGTFVNGKRVQSATLSAGDTVVIGSVKFVVQLDGVPTDDEIAQPATPEVGGAERTILTDPTDQQSAESNGEHFDPSQILAASNDSGSLDAMDNSAIAHDIAADIDRGGAGR